MNLLIDIGHPAHVHLFRNFYREMREKGHNVLVTARTIPAAEQSEDFDSQGGKL